MHGHRTGKSSISYSVRNGRFDLWEMGADGSNPQRLTSQRRIFGFCDPAVSLHGGFIAFDKLDRNNKPNIWRMDMDGGNLKQLTEGREDYIPAISPDGRWVVFTQGQGGKFTLMKVPSEGGPASQLTDYNSTLHPSPRTASGLPASPFPARISH